MTFLKAGTLFHVTNNNSFCGSKARGYDSSKKICDLLGFSDRFSFSLKVIVGFLVALNITGKREMGSTSVPKRLNGSIGPCFLEITCSSSGHLQFDCEVCSSSILGMAIHLDKCLTRSLAHSHAREVPNTFVIQIELVSFQDSSGNQVLINHRIVSVMEFVSYIGVWVSNVGEGNASLGVMMMLKESIPMILEVLPIQEFL